MTSHYFLVQILAESGHCSWDKHVSKKRASFSDFSVDDIYLVHNIETFLTFDRSSSAKTLLDYTFEECCHLLDFVSSTLANVGVTFKVANIKGRPPKHYNPLLQKEKHLESVVRRILPKQIADIVCPKGSRLAHLYGLSKTHKPQLAMRPILFSSRYVQLCTGKVAWRESQTVITHSVHNPRHLLCRGSKKHVS